jgi:hypothetical protein
MQITTSYNRRGFNSLHGERVPKSFMARQPSTTLADFRGRGIPKSLFL